MSGPKIGDRVHVPAFDGVVTATGCHTPVQVQRADGTDELWIQPEHLEVIERATPPEPTELGAMVGVDLEVGPDDACVAIRLTDEPGKAWEVSGSEDLRAWEYFVASNNTVTILTPGGEA